MSTMKLLVDCSSFSTGSLGWYVKDQQISRGQDVELLGTPSPVSNNGGDDVDSLAISVGLVAQMDDIVVMQDDPIFARGYCPMRES